MRKRFLWRKRNATSEKIKSLPAMTPKQNIIIIVFINVASTATPMFHHPPLLTKKYNNNKY